MCIYLQLKPNERVLINQSLLKKLCACEVFKPKAKFKVLLINLARKKKHLKISIAIKSLIKIFEFLDKECVQLCWFP